MPETPRQPDERELDALLDDVKQLLGDEPENKPAPPQTSAPRASDVHIDYEKFYGEIPPDPAPSRVPDAPTQVFQPLTAYEQSKPAYQTARRALYEKQREQERLAREQERQAREAQEEQAVQALEQKKKRRRADLEQTAPMDSAAYAQWLYEQGDGSETREHRRVAAEFAEEKDENVPKKRKKHKPWWLVFPAALLLIALALVVFAKQPKAADGGLGERVRGSSTILLCGTDEGGWRTDTMMLLNVSRKDRSMRLVSIPRDTLVYCSYSVPKINSAYGWAGGGEEGMDELLSRVSEIIGFRPDGYMLIGLETFEQLVDCMGGVTFDVPVDMQYSDPAQGLEIDLSVGRQRLNGAQAMQLVRFRSGYADADLGRVNVQRDFMRAALSQWASPLKLVHAPKALKLLTESVSTDLSAQNILWLAESVLLCKGDVQSATLPGTPMNIAGGSYYVLDAQGVADLVNSACNPYQEGVSAADLSIRNG